MFKCFHADTDRVEKRAVREDTLALHAEEYGKATVFAKKLETLEAVPEAAGGSGTGSPATAGGTGT